MFVGTITNVATVIAGTTVGALAGRRFPARLRETVTATLGLLTAALAVREVIKTDEFVLVLAAVLAGALLGELARIETGARPPGGCPAAAGGGPPRRGGGCGRPGDGPAPGGRRRGRPRRLARRLVPRLAAASARASWSPRWSSAWGPLAVIGSIQDGLGDPEMLLVKAALDGFASLAFASVYGWGVGLSALSVGLYQGAIALGGGYLEAVLSDPMLDALASAGGILLLGISLRLLGLKEVRVANLLPAVVLAPLFVHLWG